MSRWFTLAFIFYSEIQTRQKKHAKIWFVLSSNDRCLILLLFPVLCLTLGRPHQDISFHLFNQQTLHTGLKSCGFTCSAMLGPIEKTAVLKLIQAFLSCGLVGVVWYWKTFKGRLKKYIGGSMQNKKKEHE